MLFPVKHTKHHKCVGGTKMAAMRKLENFFGVVCPLYAEIHLGNVEHVIHTSFEAWVTLFALRGICERVVFRFKIHDYSKAIDGMISYLN